MINHAEKHMVNAVPLLLLLLAAFKFHPGCIEYFVEPIFLRSSVLLSIYLPCLYRVFVKAPDIGTLLL